MDEQRGANRSSSPVDVPYVHLPDHDRGATCKSGPEGDDQVFMRPLTKMESEDNLMRLVSMEDDPDIHKMSIGHQDDPNINPENQVRDAMKIESMIRQSVDDALKSKGTIAVRVNNHRMHRQQAVDLPDDEEIRRKASTGAVIIVH